MVALGSTWAFLHLDRYCDLNDSMCLIKSKSLEIEFDASKETHQWHVPRARICNQVRIFFRKVMHND